jgi:hypothetical protein
VLTIASSGERAWASILHASSDHDWTTPPYDDVSSQISEYQSTHGGVDVRVGGDEKQIINFAWPKGYARNLGVWGDRLSLFNQI